jgi:hypothetical protein
MSARPADAPSVSNYIYGSGTIRYRTAGQGAGTTYKVLGNLPTIRVNRLTDEKEHFDAQTQENDLTLLIRRGWETTFGSDELNSDNFALLADETVSAQTGYDQIPLGNLKVASEWEIQVEITELGTTPGTRIYHFWRCTFRPDSAGEFGDDWGKWGGTFKAKRDTSHLTDGLTFGWKRFYDSGQAIPLS